MGTRGKILLLVLALALLVAGCGSDDSLDPQAAAEAQITAKDLPGKVTVEESVPTEPCGPLPIFRKNEGKTAVTQLLGIGKEIFGVGQQVRLKEAVGAFDDEENAEAAYDALVAQDRIDCLQKSIESGSTVQDPVKVSKPQSFGVGDEDSLTRFTEIDPENPLPYILDMGSIRSGQCVASVVFLVAERNPSYTAERKVAQTVADRLASVCGE